MLVSKIVLTGGPCAGKTTALSRIEENLIEQGYQVFVVSESATELIKGGIRPFGDKRISMIEFQNLIVKYQLSKEQIYLDAIKCLPEDRKCVIIYDRGVIDNKAYIGSDQFNIVLQTLNLNELNLMDNYDMVIHLVTAAEGLDYTTENNKARTESKEEAIALDKKTMNAWIGHNNLKIIDNCVKFEEKMNKVLDEINNLLGNPVSIRQQKKYIVDIEKSNFEFINNNSIKIDIEQTYLDDYSGYEKRLRKRTVGGENTYYFTAQIKDINGISKVLTDKKITEKDYYKLLDSNQKKFTINKTRYSFIDNKQYFKLDIFENNLALLEVEATKENKEIKVPMYLNIIKDVTNDEEYFNSNIARRIKSNILIKSLKTNGGIL